MTDADKQRERDAIEAAYCDAISAAFQTMCANIKGGAGPGCFPADLASARTARVQALAFLETQQQGDSP